MSKSSDTCAVDTSFESKQSKMDKAASDLMCNIAIADITKVNVDDFVKQITLIDMSYFAAIKRSEFLSLKWSGRDKKIYAPNIVESTRWFNRLNFWVQKEILKYPSVNKRTEMLSYFIKLAKRLVDVNNLYSAMSIVSALQVECVYRLRLTWSGLGQRERSAYRRLEELFGQQDNCRLLREHTASMRLPGIPYLGLYLSDLIYTNVAHPRINGQPTTVWVTKLNTIVDAIAHFQQSRFPYQVNENIRAYLLAQSYIEELQKFLEDANYKMSLSLEPPLVMEVTPQPSPVPSPQAALSSAASSSFDNGGGNQRRGVSAVARFAAATGLTKPSTTQTSGYISDQEQQQQQLSLPRKKLSHSATSATSQRSLKSFSKVASALGLGGSGGGGGGGAEGGGRGEAVSFLEETEKSMKTSGVSTVATAATVTVVPKYSVPPDPVGLLLDSGCSKGAGLLRNGGKANDISEGGRCNCDASSSEGITFASSPTVPRVLTQDQSVQVPQPSDSSSNSSSSTLTSPCTKCLLCGRPSEASSSSSPTSPGEVPPASPLPQPVIVEEEGEEGRQKKPKKSYSVEVGSAPSMYQSSMASSSAIEAGASPSSAAPATTFDPSHSVEPLIVPTVTSSPRPRSQQDRDLYSAVMAVANLKVSSTARTNGDLKSRSDSGASFSMPSQSRDDEGGGVIDTGIRAWPPLTLPHLTALRPACVLCEGPVLRKTVGRLIPPGLDQSNVGGALSDSEDVFVSAMLPQQRHRRNTAWKTFWAALVVLEGWASAYMVYFEALTKKPRFREEFSTGQCQIQPFQSETPGASTGTSYRPSIGLARHRNGSVDETSFLLTHPGLSKTYRLRPLPVSASAASTVATNGSSSPSELGNAGAPLTPTLPPRGGHRDSTRRLFSTLSRKNSAVCTETPRTPTSPSSLRGRGASVPMLAASSPLDSGVRPNPPSVDDWLHALQTTLDQLQ